MASPIAVKVTVCVVALTLSSPTFAQNVVTDYLDSRLYPAHVTAVNFESQRLAAGAPIVIDNWRVSLKVQMQTLFGEHVANSKKQKPEWGVIIHAGCVGPGETEQRNCVLILKRGGHEIECRLVVHDVAGFNDNPQHIKINCPRSIELAAQH